VEYTQYIRRQTYQATKIPSHQLSRIIPQIEKGAVKNFNPSISTQHTLRKDTSEIAERKAFKEILEEPLAQLNAFKCNSSSETEKLEKHNPQ
jgi:arsenate reductase-like glutaredoxin family protein